MSAAVIVDHVVKRFGNVTALCDVTVEVGAGEVFGLLGPNGAGKTTLLDCVAGLQDVDSGRVVTLGRSPRAARANVGFAMQRLGLPEGITPREALRLSASWYRRTDDVSERLAHFGLAHKSDVPVSHLSQGQQQRLNLALALLHDPGVVLLDEPTNGLDPAMKEEFFTEIDAVAAGGVAVILTTHTMEDAQRRCDRVALINHGRVVACGRPTELIDVRCHTLWIEADGLLQSEWFAGLPSATCRECKGHAATFESAEPAAAIAQVVERLRQRRLSLRRLQVEPPSLEQAYLSLIASTNERP